MRVNTEVSNWFLAGKQEQILRNIRWRGECRGEVQAAETPDDEDSVTLSKEALESGEPDAVEREEEETQAVGQTEQEGASQTSGVSMSTSSPEDSSGALTRRLVAAGDQFEVQMILSEAFKNMTGLRMIAAMGSGDDAKTAKTYLRKMEKVVRRGRRKIKDLGKEEALTRNQIRAEREHQKERAREIKAELRKRMLERKRRENGYLKDAQEEQAAKSSGKDAELDPASEAQLEAEAQAMAQAEVAVESSSGGGAGETGGTGGDAGSGEVSADAGGEAAADGGGSVD